MGILQGTIYTINQKGDERNYPWVYSQGCGICAAGMAAAYYAQKPYTLADCDKAGLIDNPFSWNVDADPKLRIGCTYTYAYMDGVSLAEVRAEIDKGQPPLVCFTYPHEKLGTGQHWVMVYGYEGEGTDFSQILIVDPVGGEKTKLINSIIRYTGGDGSTGTLRRMITTAKKAAAPAASATENKDKMDKHA